jgi:L-ascorbate metabolism protein UlaG (beta-lactamase superfamily)
MKISELKVILDEYLSKGLDYEIVSHDFYDVGYYSGIEVDEIDFSSPQFEDCYRQLKRDKYLLIGGDSDL